ncbi:MAG: peptidyl-prolyl cis-trans isomerase [Thermodesulfobacteriota bacterium]
MRVKINKISVPGYFIWLFLLVFLLPTEASGEVVDRVVAVVNDSIITLSELKAAFAVSGKVTEGETIVLGKDKFTREAASGIIDELIEQKLIKQGADRAGIEVSEEDIEIAVEDVMAQNRVNMGEFLIALADSGLTLKEYRDQLKERIREIKFVNKHFRSKVIIEDEDMEEYYAQNMDDFNSPSAARLRIIFFSNNDMALRDRRLKLVEKELKDGIEFKELAKEYSEGPSASGGGDLGFLAAEEMDKTLAGAADLLIKPGEVSPPIYTRGGVTLIQLVERRGEEPMSFNRVKFKIRETLFKKFLNENFNYWLKEARKMAHIEVRL